MMNLTLEHQGRELLHGIALLLQCMRLPVTTATERRDWWAELRRSRVDLAELYVAGLPRNFRHKLAG